jgi:hypothetical protein
MIYVPESVKITQKSFGYIVQWTSRKGKRVYGLVIKGKWYFMNWRSNEYSG